MSRRPVRGRGLSNCSRSIRNCGGNILKEFIVTESEGFRLRVKSWKCLSPADLNSIEFIQETLTDGEVVGTSTYNFHMTDDEIAVLCNGLSQPD
jgi:hypothetical protein